MFIKKACSFRKSVKNTPNRHYPVGQFLSVSLTFYPQTLGFIGFHKSLQIKNKPLDFLFNM